MHGPRLSVGRSRLCTAACVNTRLHQMLYFSGIECAQDRITLGQPVYDKVTLDQRLQDRVDLEERV